MAEFPALPLWTDAYLGDTTHLTTIEHGAYLLLLMTAWRSRDCCLPDDDKLLARYTRLGARQWVKMRSVLAPFFTIENGVWRQRRLTDEAVAVRQRKEKAAAAGRASALSAGAANQLKRHNRHATSVDPKLNLEPTPLQPELNITNTSTSIPLDKESNGVAVDPDKAFWDTAKTYLSDVSRDPGALVGKWCRDHGKSETAQALTRAQLERPVEKIPFIQGCLRKRQSEPERPLC